MSAVLAITTARAADPLDEAVQDYVRAKRDEEAAAAARLRAEQRILALRPAKEEASMTFEAGGFKVTTTGKLAYKCADPQALLQAGLAMGLDRSMVPVKVKTELDATGCKWLRNNEPETWALLAGHVSIEPAKTAISVKV